MAAARITDQGQVLAVGLGPDGLDHYVTLTPNISLSTILGQASDSPPIPPSNPPPVSPPKIPEPAAIYLLGLVGGWAAMKRLRARLAS